METDIQKEIEEMIGDNLSKVTSEEKEVFAEEDPKEAPKEEVKEPVVETPKEEVREEVKEETPPVTEETPPATTEEVEDPRIKAMQATINEMAQRILVAGGAQPQPIQAVQPPPPPQDVEIDLEKFQILPEGVDFEDVVNDKASFEKFMRGLLGRYEVTRVRRDALATPTLVSRQVQYTLGLHEAVRNFYDTNKDLVGMKPLVGAFSNKFVAEHPDWSLAQVMEESAKATRAAVGMGVAKPAVAPVGVKKDVKPSFATTNASRNVTGGVKKTKLQSEIEDLLTDL
jgi:hypothetical protein